MQEQGSVEALVGLGFTSLEAEVYTFLLQESPATGYRVAQAIGKPFANTYKSIECLVNKGAVIVDEGASRMCRAVPAEELLSQIERRFAERRSAAARALAELQSAPDDDRVYQLSTPEQVMARCRAMLTRCTQVAMLDLFPAPVEMLRPDLEAAAARGARIVAKVRQPVEMKGVEVILSVWADASLARYPGHWIILVVDGTEFLFAFLTEDGREVRQAVWSGSAYLSWIIHSAVASENILCGALHDSEAGPPMWRVLSRYEDVYGLDVPGYRALIKRFAPNGKRGADGIPTEDGS